MAHTGVKWSSQLNYNVHKCWTKNLKISKNIKIEYKELQCEYSLSLPEGK